MRSKGNDRCTETVILTPIALPVSVPNRSHRGITDGLTNNKRIKQPALDRNIGVFDDLLRGCVDPWGSRFRAMEVSAEGRGREDRGEKKGGGGGRGSKEQGREHRGKGRAARSLEPNPTAA